MFKDTKAFSGFSAPDIEAERAFYGDTLGIETSVEYGLLTLHLAGGERPTLVYPKPDHVPATYTILNFPVDDIEAAVDELVSRGGVMEGPGGENPELGAWTFKFDRGADGNQFKLDEVMAADALLLGRT